MDTGCLCHLRASRDYFETIGDSQRGLGGAVCVVNVCGVGLKILRHVSSA